MSLRLLPLGAVAALVIACAGLSQTGCGQGTGADEDAIRRSLAALHDAYLQERYDVACSHLTRGAQLEIGYMGHSAPTTCERDMARRLSAHVLSPDDMSPPRIRSLDVDGTRATARAVVDRSKALDVSFSKVAGRWKLARVYGGGDADVAAPRTAATRSPDGDVSVGFIPSGSEAGRPCPRLRVRTITADGGCAIWAIASATYFVYSVFGDRLYGQCRVQLELNVDARGRFVATRVQGGGNLTSTSTTCGDIGMCKNRDGEPLLWHGHIAHTTERYSLTIRNACLGTCLGEFSGPIRLPLRLAQRTRLQVSANREPVGSSGLAVSGDWTLATVTGDFRLTLDARAK